MQGETASTALFRLKQHLPAAPPATRCLVVWQVSHESILQTDWGQPDDVSDDVTELRVYWSTNTTVTAAETTISPVLLFYLCTCSVIWHMCDGSANLPCMEHESVQQQTVKTASGYIWRRIIQFPWKPGDRDNCCEEELWLWFCLPVIRLHWSFRSRNHPHFRQPTADGAEVRGQSCLTGRASHTGPKILFSSPWTAERGVLCGGCSWPSEQYFIFLMINWISSLTHTHFKCINKTKSLQHNEAQAQCYALS